MSSTSHRPGACCFACSLPVLKSALISLRLVHVGLPSRALCAITAIGAEVHVKRKKKKKGKRKKRKKGEEKIK
jgi:hypothetical protein